jgi:hypothetical protein
MRSFSDSLNVQIAMNEWIQYLQEQDINAAEQF